MIRNINDDIYLKEGFWKCSHSSTNAHSWILSEGKQICNFCKKTKVIVSGEDAERKGRRRP